MTHCTVAHGRVARRQSTGVVALQADTQLTPEPTPHCTSCNGRCSSRRCRARTHLAGPRGATRRFWRACATPTASALRSSRRRSCSAHTAAPPRCASSSPAALRARGIDFFFFSPFATTRGAALWCNIARAIQCRTVSRATAPRLVDTSNRIIVPRRPRSVVWVVPRNWFNNVGRARTNALAAFVAT